MDRFRSFVLHLLFAILVDMTATDVHVTPESLDSLLGVSPIAPLLAVPPGDGGGGPADGGVQVMEGGRK